MRAIKPLYTNRLVLRPSTPSDAPALFSMYSDTETMRFMPFLPHQHEQETAAYIEHLIAPDDAAVWTICLTETNQPIGIVEYLSNTPIPGMGYIIKREHWGQGITAEACRAALAYGFDQLGFDRVELWINEDNVASQRVADKLGFRLKGQIAQRYAHERNHHIMLTYGLWAAEFRGEEPDRFLPRIFRAQSVLLTHDVFETAAFYRDKLEFRVDFLYGDPPDHGAVSFGAWTGRGVTFQLSRVAQERELSVSTYQYIFTDTGLDRLYETYVKRQVEIVREPETFPWGMREFAVRDNNGHLLVFGTNA